MQVHRVPGDRVAATAAGVVADALRDALRRRGRATVAFSGGRSPAGMLRDLAGRDLDWTRVHVFQVDERIAPEGHADRNLGLLRRELLDHVDAVAHPLPVTADDLPAAAAAYADELAAHAPGGLDVVHLGLGADGHTASLFPGDAVTAVRDRSVAVTGSHAGRRRMTLTAPVLAAAHLRLWLVTGGDKAAALDALLEGPATARPAARLPRERSVVVTDLRTG